MGLIWQEFKAIVSDAWNKIAALGKQLLAEIIELLRQLAANYQLAIVLSVGLPLSFFLLGIPFFAAIEGLMAPLKEVMNPREETRRFFDGSFVQYAVMFAVGCVVITLTVELADRISKRLEGKTKDDSPIRPGEEVIEVVEALDRANSSAESEA
jgi:hypothetical protein